MAYAEKTPAEWRTFYGVPDDYRPDALVLYGTWPHDNKVTANHLPILTSELERTGVPFSLRSLANTSLLPDRPVEYLEHAYELTTNDHAGQPLTSWIVPVEGTRIASQYVHAARVFGAQKMVVLGMCAGLQEGMRRGQFVAPTAVRLNDTGRAFNAAREAYVARPDPWLRESLIGRLAVHAPDATVWPTIGYTDEAILAQTRRRVNGYRGRGYGSIDMESGLAFAVAANPSLGRPIPAAALSYIVDQPGSGSTYLDGGYVDPDGARTLQYRIALEEIRDVPLPA